MSVVTISLWGSILSLYNNVPDSNPINRLYYFCILCFRRLGQPIFSLHKISKNSSKGSSVKMEMLSLILTIIGILVSAIGLYYAIAQVKGLKKITKEYQEQVNQEVSLAQNKIRDGLYISEVTLCIKNLESSIKYIREGRAELALLRMEDIETTLHNTSLSEKYLDYNQQRLFKEAIGNYQDSLRSVMKNNKDENNLNIEFIIDSLSSIRGFLSIMDNKLKDSLYGKGS